jgi:hypothetical protein
LPDCNEDLIICNWDYLCECLCDEEHEYCGRDPEYCCIGLVCDVFTNTCTPECTSDADCHARTEIPHAGDLKCNNGVCDFDRCSTDADCPPGKVCFEGYCISPAECADIAECKIEPASAATSQGTTIQFSATAYSPSGSLAPGIAFAWATSDSNVAAVDSNGLATGGSQAGTATITATATGCAISCQATVQNYADVPAGLTRVLVVDELAGTPVPGATVVVGAETPVTTNADGVAEFPVVLSSASPADVTVSSTDYHYIALKAVESSDIIVHLGKIYHLDQNENEVAGGIKGRFNFSLARCEPPNRTCDVYLGLGGLSLPGSLTHANPRLILGDNIVVPMEFGGVTVDVPLPEGLTLGLGSIHYKEYYYPTGVPGSRAAWGMGGRVDLAMMISRLMSAIYDGSELGMVRAILGILGVSATHSAIRPNVEISPILKIQDAGDLNGNGETTDFIPDYDDFPYENMTLKVPMIHTMTFNPPLLPVGTYDAILIISGVIVPGEGLVPLGISAGLDALDHNDRPDGIIDDPIVLRTSEVAGRIPEEGAQRVILILAFNTTSLVPDPAPQLNLGGQVLFVNDFDGTTTLSSFMDPAEVTYDPATRRLDITQLPTGSDYIQATFEDDKSRQWHLLAQNPTSTDLPPAPTEGDRPNLASFTCIDLLPGVTYQDLPAFNDTNLGDLAALVSAFSFTETPLP